MNSTSTNLWKTPLFSIDRDSALDGVIVLRGHSMGCSERALIPYSVADCELFVSLKELLCYFVGRVDTPSSSEEDGDIDRMVHGYIRFLGAYHPKTTLSEIQVSIGDLERNLPIFIDKFHSQYSYVVNGHINACLLGLIRDYVVNYSS